MNGRLKGFAGGIAAAFAVLMLSGPALADGYRSVKDAPKPEARRCNLSANIALTTEYVFRGFSQTAEGPAVQGGFDVTCGIFYAGVWASSLDFGGDAIWGGLGNEDVAHIEMDWYLGIKPVTGKITWDLGVIYYTYPNSIDPIGRDLNYVEIKVGASAEIWKDGTLGVTVFYSPDYQLETEFGVDGRDLVRAGAAEGQHLHADVQRLDRLSGRSRRLPTRPCSPTVTTTTGTGTSA